MAIVTAVTKEPQPQSIRAACDEADAVLALEHWVFGRRHPVHLEEVIHERQRAHANSLARWARSLIPGPMPEGAETSRIARRADRLAWAPFYTLGPAASRLA